MSFVELNHKMYCICVFISRACITTGLQHRQWPQDTTGRSSVGKITCPGKTLRQRKWWRETPTILRDSCYSEICHTDLADSLCPPRILCHCFLCNIQENPMKGNKYQGFVRALQGIASAPSRKPDSCLGRGGVKVLIPGDWIFAAAPHWQGSYHLY